MASRIRQYAGEGKAEVKSRQVAAAPDHVSTVGGDVTAGLYRAVARIGIGALHENSVWNSRSIRRSGPPSGWLPAAAAHAGGHPGAEVRGRTGQGRDLPGPRRSGLQRDTGAD